MYKRAAESNNPYARIDFYQQIVDNFPDSEYADDALFMIGFIHSEIMAPAAEKLSLALAEADIIEPPVPVMSNVDASLHNSPDSIKQKLLDQLVSPVRWQLCMEWLLDSGVEKYYEIGPGRVLSGLMRRIKRKTDFTSINSAAAIEKVF